VLRVIFIVGLVLALLTLSSQAAGLTATANQLRALYVQRLVKYVSWPRGVAPDDGEPYIVAAIDPASLKPYFTGQAGTQFRIVQWPVEDYHILVLIGAPEREISAILKRVSGKPVLTISQNPVNLKLGVIINFYMYHGRLKLEINPVAARNVGLSISSRLLQLARIYEGGIDE